MDNATLTTFLTLVIAGASVMTFLIYRAILDANKQIERAYIGFGHSEPNPEMGKAAYFSLQVHNFGNTPATVRQVVVAYRISNEPLPARPRYEQRLPIEESRVFLVKTGEFWTRPVPMGIDGTEWDRIIAGEKTLWILGYVDYTDRFTQMHRGRFARVYDVPNRRLTFESKANYNDDQPIQEGQSED
jgi:hypothetical protein